VRRRATEVGSGGEPGAPVARVHCTEEKVVSVPGSEGDGIMDPVEAVTAPLLAVELVRTFRA